MHEIIQFFWLCIGIQVKTKQHFLKQFKLRIKHKYIFAIMLILYKASLKIVLRNGSILIALL